MAEMKAEFPLNWRIGQDFDPNDHLMQLKGRDYLNVQSRLLWFIRDQRALIVAGLATMPYIVRSELVEQDREAGWAHFKTYVRDVLGNETTMYGSESAKDFGDYAEKASTKSLGRALLALGYGTGFAPEMDEGERVVDSPVERRSQQAAQTPRQSQAPAPVTPIRPVQSQQSQQAAPASARSDVRSEPTTKEERTRAAGEAAFTVAEMDRQIADADSQKLLARKLLAFFGTDETGEHKALRAWLGGQLDNPG